MNKTLKFLALGCFLAVVAYVAPSYAQTFSSQGIGQSIENTQIRECADGAMVAQERVLNLQQRVNTILNCNRQGQVYDRNAGICVNPGLSPDHVFRTRSAGDTLAFLNPDGAEGAQVVLGGRDGTSVTCVENPTGCTFAGNTLEHGDTVTAYRVSSVSFGDSCSETTNVETRTCENGTLTGSYTNDTCGEGDPNSCTAPWGATVAHGSSVTAYEFERVSSSGNCNSQQRTCNNGTLSGTFRYEACETDLPVTPEPPTSNCFFYVSGIVPGATVIAGSDGDHVGRGAYPDATIPFAKANAGTFDTIAIGPKTRLVIYKGKNFKNGEFIDIKGPKIIGNKCLKNPDFSRDWKTGDAKVASTIGFDGNLKVASTVYKDMFPPSTRIEHVMNGASAGCENNPNVPGAASQTLLWGGGSVKVFCDK